MTDVRILLTGGTGRLGSKIAANVGEHEIYAPPRDLLDVRKVGNGCQWYVGHYDPITVIIHCAAYANALRAESNREECWRVNVEGTRNMVRAAEGRRFVYISTDYVFDGREGNYSESDAPNPVNFYGVSKLAAEMIVSEHPNTLIIRAPFRSDPPWRFPKAFSDQWTSCRFVSEVAPDIVKAALSDATGILHIGGPRRSIYELATSVPGEVGETTRAKFPGLTLPRDTSLNSSRWQALQKQMQGAECALLA